MQRTLRQITLKFWVLVLIFFIRLPWDCVQASTEFIADSAKLSVNDWVRFRVLIAIPSYVTGSVESICAAVIDESRRFDFDPILLLSIIEVESGFAVKKRGDHGEIGLMQVRPTTARWIAKKSGLIWYGAKTLEDPASNIQMGTAYLYYLRKSFSAEHQLYLSAYNMGARNVRKALKKQIVPKDYAFRVFLQYHRLYFGELNTTSSVSL